MKNQFLLFALCVGQIIVATQCKDVQGQDKDPSVDFESRVASISKTIETVIRIHDVPAVSACIVAGEETFFINHGTLDRSSDEKVDEESLYQLASLSKTFIGLIVLELIQDKTIKTSDSIADYLPKTIDEKTRLKVQSISILDLLSHRSGLPRDTLNPKLRHAGTYVNNDYDESDLLKDLAEMELQFAPGERFEYSNFGYSLLAYLLERVSGKSYRELLKEHVKGRMEMSDTVFELSQNQSLRMAVPYDAKNPSVAREPARIGKLSPPTALYCTTSDLAKLLKRQLADYREYQKNKKVTNLILTQHVKEAWEGSGIKYGFGFIDWGNGTFGHGGGMDGYGSEFFIDPKNNLGFILLTSSGDSWTQRLAVAVNKVMIDGQTKVLDELIAVESIVAKFEKSGPTAGLKTYQEFRNRKSSPLGEETRVTLVNLARHYGVVDAAKMFARDALADFPKSERIKELAETLDDEQGEF